MKKKKETGIDYESLQELYGKMYHLILYTGLHPEPIRFVDYSKKPRHTAVQGYPLFLSDKRQLCIATDYTIIYPKIYVKKFRLLGDFSLKELNTKYDH